MNNKKVNPKLLTYELQIIKLAVKRLQNTKFHAMILISVMLVGIFSLSPAISSLMNDVIIRSTGRIATAAPIAYKSEIRGVFVHFIGEVSDWGLIVETCKGYGINTLVIEGGYGWGIKTNAIAAAVDACHSRGIKLWVSVGLLITPPEEKMWCVDQNLNPYGWGCPTKQATISTIKDTITRLMAYDIDGFMFDYIRYDTQYLCYCPECKAKFEEWLGEVITDWPGEFVYGRSRYNEFAEWRLVPMTELVRDIRNWMLAIKPDLQFSIAAFTLFADEEGADYWRYFIGQDTADWVARGYLDVVAPMMYTTNLANIQNYFQTSSNYMVGGLEGKIPLVCFITTGVDSPVNVSDFKAAVDKVRELGADGWIIYQYGGPGWDYVPPPSLNNDIRPYLETLDMPDVFTLANIQVSTDETQATITWTSDLPATSKVEYSTSPLFTATKKWSGDFYYWDLDHILGIVVEDATPVTNHSITLTGLLPGTQYYFRVQSQDPSGIATRKVLTFTTGGVTP